MAMYEKMNSLPDEVQWPVAIVLVPLSDMRSLGGPGVAGGPVGRDLHLPVEGAGRKSSTERDDLFRRTSRTASAMFYLM